MQPKRDFTDALTDLAYGQVHEQASDSLAEVVAAVLATNKVGSITVKLTIKPEGDRQVSVRADIGTKVPKASTAQTILFATPDGELRQSDPKQMTLKSVVERVNAELKEVKVGGMTGKLVAPNE